MSEESHQVVDLRQLKKCFYDVGTICNIVEVFQDLEVSLTKETLTTLVEASALSITDSVVIPIKDTTHTPDFAALKKITREKIVAYITDKLPMDQRSFRTPLETIADHIANTLVDQVEEATKASFWQKLTELYSGPETKEQQVAASMKVWGTIEKCAEVLEMICTGFMKKTGPKVEMDFTVKIRAVTLNLPATELELYLKKGDLVRRLEWTRKCPFALASSST